MPHVTERTLVQRINRALQPEGEEVRKAPDFSTCIEHGRYYLARGRYVLQPGVDLEQLGRCLNVLAHGEVIQPETQ